MAPQLATPAVPPSDVANERFKSHFRSIFWGGMIAATLAHFGAFAFAPELTTDDFSITVEELTAIELPPEIEIPPPPKSIARPATPVIAATTIDEEITIAPTTFESNPVGELPPPPEVEEVADLADAPTFTPFTVAPEILNRRELSEAMRRSYPPLLREAGIGGTVRVFFFIDEAGTVLQTRLDQSSGHQQLDDAALAVAAMYRFSPALNRDTRVKVWVSFPVMFQVN
jgi:protein TonB